MINYQPKMKILEVMKQYTCLTRIIIILVITQVIDFVISNDVNKDEVGMQSL